MTDRDLIDYFFDAMRNPDLCRTKLAAILDFEGIKYQLWLNINDLSCGQIDELQFKYQNTEWRIYFKLPEGKIYRVKCLMYHNEEKEDD